MIKREKIIFDANGKVLGRLATEIAKVLSGRNKIDYVPNIDGGDFAVVINSDKVRVTGNKASGKMYHHFSGYPGGISSIAFKDQIKKDSRKIIKSALFGMLPKNNLRSKMMLRLKIYKGAEQEGKKVEATK
ncbi:MAG TPA: 50S ribosomal protein L13 [Candidatus Moranbacteria bacterium]|nr:50S ribosomal protein L13 [Candidatus Moranbacteria bacterium]